MSAMDDRVSFERQAETLDEVRPEAESAEEAYFTGREAPSSSKPEAPRAVSRRERLRPWLFALLPVALLIGAVWYVMGGSVVSTENAYIRADMLGVSTDVSGIVKDIDVVDNQKVEAGDVLFTLDDKPFRLALDQAQAQVGITRDDLNALKASYRDMQAQIAQAQVDIDFYEKQFDRQKTLAGNNYASRSALDEAQRNLDGARRKKSSLEQQLAGIAANLSGDPDAPVEQHPRYKAAVAARDEAARQLAHTIVRAPFSGIVTNVSSLQIGQYLAASTAAFSIVSDQDVWVEANPKETQLSYVHPGQSVTVTVDTYPGVEWQGTVDSLSPASASSFSLLPAQNTSGNWVKVVQRIPLRVRIRTSPDKPILRSGMSAEIEIDTGHARGIPFFSGGDYTAQRSQDGKSHG